VAFGLSSYSVRQPSIFRYLGLAVYLLVALLLAPTPASHADAWGQDVAVANDHCCGSCAQDAHGLILPHCADGQSHVCCGVLPVAVGSGVPVASTIATPHTVLQLSGLALVASFRPPRDTVAA
jgi:hypothetical protein